MLNTTVNDGEAFLVEVRHLVGRRIEQERIEDLIDATRLGHGRVLVLKGEAGIGKSALLDHAAAAASGFRVVRASGAESEQELPYAALHQLCVPLLRHLTVLADQHRDALRVAFGLTDGSADPFRVGMATLELFTAAAQDRPLLCLVDDAQWLDAASTRAMVFIARRLTVDSVAVLFATRPVSAPGELEGLPDVAIGNLRDEDAEVLLAAMSPLPLDEKVRDRLIAEAKGNPFALREVPRAGGFCAPVAPLAPTRIEHETRSRFAGLSPDARMLLIVASADPTGDPGLLRAAARVLDLEVVTARIDVMTAGLVAFSTRVLFCHPLVRSAIYRLADDRQRRTAHEVLAEVTDPVLAPDRRAWHRAEAGVGPDDEIAEQLEQCASRAEARGGVGAAAAFLERAAGLTGDTGRRIERTLIAAMAHVAAGSKATAAKLISTLEIASLSERQRADAEMLLGRIAFLRPAEGCGTTSMVHAARRLSSVDPARARECLLEALEMNLRMGCNGDCIDVTLEAARAAANVRSTPDVLDALMLLATEGHKAAAPIFESAMRGGDDPLWTRFPALAAAIADELWDVETRSAIVRWLSEAGRRSGSPNLLRYGLALKSVDSAVTGDMRQAIVAAADEQALADAAGEAPLLHHRLYLAAVRGRPEEFESLTTSDDRETACSHAAQIADRHVTAALLHNGVGNYPAALAAARRAAGDDGPLLHGLALPELVEAAVRCGEMDVATRAADALAAQVQVNGSVTGRGVAATARALVTGVEDHYRQAVECLAESPLLLYRARAHLLYGQWLRRAGRRRECRHQLSTALELFSSAGAEGFARRAAVELRAAGEKVHGRHDPTFERLTMQELAVARLVAGGATSKEVAGQLIVSKRTVDAHLRSIFRKLGIGSRRQLERYPNLVHR